MISGPSGAGKSSLVDALIATDAHIAPSVSHTTRPPRGDETDARHYHFVDQSRFESLVDSGAFLEHAWTYGHRYGTSVSAVDHALKAGTDVALQIDWQGAHQVRSRIDRSTSIFILPPSHQTLSNRLNARGQDSKDTIAQRLRLAKDEIAHYEEFDYIVINDDFNRALADLCAIVRTVRLRRDECSAKHRTLIDSLLS